MPEQFLLLHVRSGADIGYHGKPGSPVTSASYQSGISYGLASIIVA